MKKILSFLLALALLIGIIPMSFASAATLTDAVKSNYSIETTLSDGIIQKTAKRTFFVIAKDGDGNKVTPTATFNGDVLSPTWDDATQTSFTLNFTVEGENTVVVSAGDAELTYTITYQPAEDGEYVGQAIFSIEAFSLGEGYIVEPVFMPATVLPRYCCVCLTALDSPNPIPAALKAVSILQQLRTARFPISPSLPSTLPQNLLMRFRLGA